MKFSTLTKESIIDAYSKLESINRGMVDAGITRHILDWYWGVNLSRALTLAVRRARGYTTLSIGRVQGPSLKILASRERQIKAFKPVPFWELEMICLKDNCRVKALHSEGKFWDKEKAKKIKDRCGKIAIVSKIQIQERQASSCQMGLIIERSLKIWPASEDIPKDRRCYFQRRN
ncbi:MAG: hypothetical protein B6U86_05580 [Candidatus Altiarchaeales archaeon ex4484_43]|nr:MAG: hypothetical protein B6U86_05580 [Candidatus Altiarchaeales archaeon ex4484_43]